MNNVKVNQTLCRIIQVFYLLGWWRKDEEESALSKTGRKLFYMFYYFLFQIFLVTCAYLSETTNETIFLLSVEIILSVVTIKMMYLLWKKDEINGFIFDPIIAHSTIDAERDAGTYELVNKKLKTFMNYMHFYMLMLFITFLFYIFSTLPVFTNDRKLPFFISFTLSGKYSDVIYWITYIFVMSEIFIGGTCTLFNVMIWYIMFNYSIEYQVLAIQLRNLGTNKMTITNVPSTIHLLRRTKFYEYLIWLIRRHRTIFRTIDRFKSFFSKLFLAQITTSGVTICVSAYILAYSSTDNLFQIPIFIVILLYGLFDIYTVMYLANDISLASDTLSYALFESAWIGQPKYCMKSILILGEIVKPSQQLVIWKIYPMNLDTFTKILNGAYSLFNILQNLN